MKRFLTILAAVSAVWAVSSCTENGKIENQDAPTITWDSNPDFGTIEINDDLKADITIKAPAGIKSLVVTVKSEELEKALEEIGITSSDLDLVNDKTVIDILNTVTEGKLPTGDALLNQTDVKFDITALVRLIVAQPGSSHSFVINLSDNNGKNVSKTCTFAVPVSSWAASYGLAEYKSEASHSLGGESYTNWPLSGALYSEWACEDATSGFYSAFFRYLGGSILPNVLNTVTLEADGNITAKYMENPVIALDPSSIMLIIFTGSFPEVDPSGFPTSGFADSPKNLATYTEKDGKIYVKLNIGEILSSSMGGENIDGLQQIIDQILSQEPAEIKEMIKLLGIDLDKVSDATIIQLQGWLKNGIPMNIEERGGHTYIYLDKSAFDNLVKPDATGESSDMIVIWGALVNAGIIPQEAAAAGILLQMFNEYWPTTTTFNLGLDLIRK